MIRLYAHRGASAELPENTLAAFARALELGADALEMDVRATRDGVLVVAHDETGARTAGVARAYRDVVWTEVKGWNVPRLDDVLEAFPGALLNVDLKAPVADEAVALLRRAGAEARVCLASFRCRTIRRARALGYGGPTSLAAAEVALLLALPAAAQRGFLRPPATRAQLPVSLGRRWVIERCHALGLPVDVFTVNDVALARRLVALGVDGIMTDDPALLAPALRDRPEPAIAGVSG